jgi:hypothetical protein
MNHDTEYCINQLRGVALQMARGELDRELPDSPIPVKQWRGQLVRRLLETAEMLEAGIAP